MHNAVGENVGMDTLIVYYSRTGTTRTLAKALAAALQGDIAEIECMKYRPGDLRYFLAGYHSVAGKLPDIAVQPFPRSHYDLVLVGTPVWTSHPALPVRSFLTQGGLPSLERVGFFLTHDGHGSLSRAVDEMAALVDVPVAETLSLTGAEVRSETFAQSVASFAETLNAREYA